MRPKFLVLPLLAIHLPPTLAQFDAFNGELASVGAAISGNLSTNLPRSLALLERFELEPLDKRHAGECTAGPGGPICSATTCCAAGQRCCPATCCSSAENCFGTGECCPISAQTCGGATCCTAGASCCSSSPTGCCVSGAVCCSSTRQPCCPPGSTCCGDTCCLSGETCERKTCVSTALITSKRIVKFELDEKKNGALLRNMCNGMKGENTIELTYSGQMSESAKRRKRAAAGCVGGFCRARGQPGLNSCDEFPPAMSDEGGSTLPVLERAVNCIPGKQNSRQGQRFSTMVKNSGITKGQKFILSIDCDEVLGQLAPTTPRRDLSPEEPASEVMKRDAIAPINGVTNEDNVFPPDTPLGETTSTLVIDFGDLGSGRYTVEYKVDSGGIEAGAFILDNFGDSYASSSSALSQGQSNILTFTIEPDGELMGVGLLLSARDGNGTVVSWAFKGEDLPPDATTSRDASNAGPSGGSSSGAKSLRMECRWWIIVGIMGFITVL